MKNLIRLEKSVCVMLALVSVAVIGSGTRAEASHVQDPVKSAMELPKAFVSSPFVAVSKACGIETVAPGMGRISHYFLYSDSERACEVVDMKTTLAGIEYSGRVSYQWTWEQCYTQFFDKAVNEFDASDALEGKDSSKYRKVNMTWEDKGETGKLGCR